MLGDLAGLGLVDALHLCEFTLVTGVLQVDAPDASARLWVHDGRLTYADDGTDPEPEAHAAGLSPATWRRVASDPSLHGAVASALVDRGEDPAAVRRFVRRRIERTLAGLTRLPSVEVSTGDDPGWFGDETGVPISQAIEAARIVNHGGELVGDHTGEALISVGPTDHGPVVLGAEQWNSIAELLGATTLGALRDRLGPRRAVDVVRFLQARGLATVVTARTSEHRPRLEHP